MASDAVSADDYPYIRAWCRMAGSPPEHLTALLHLARSHSAPADAVFYRRGDDHWVTTDEIWETRLRRYLDLEPLPPITPDLDPLTEEIARGMWQSPWITDRVGLRDIQRPDVGRIRLTFATGATCDVRVRLHLPQS